MSVPLVDGEAVEQAVATGRLQVFLAAAPGRVGRVPLIAIMVAQHRLTFIGFAV